MKKSLVVIWIVSLVVVGMLGFVIAKFDLLKIASKKVESKDQSSYKIYKSEKLGVEFQYPDNFYLLDRTNEAEKAILLSDKEISFSEFADSYITPIRIKAWTNEDLAYVDKLKDKKEEKMFLGNKEVRFISGQIPANEIYKAIDYRIIIFQEKPLFIEVDNNQGWPVSFDIDKVAKDVASSVKFIK